MKMIKSSSVTGPRGHNQDRAFAFSISKYAIIGVADGVGGTPLGGEAAAIAESFLKSRLVVHPNFDLSLLFNEIHNAISVKIGNSGATTLSLARIADNIAEIAHVGDSRVYHQRGKGIITATVDQTEIAELVRRGIFTPREAKSYRRKNVLTSYLGGDRPYEIHRADVQLRDRDMLIACTDGFYEVVRKTDIIEAAMRAQADLAVLDVLMEIAARRGIRDDCSAAMYVAG